MFKILKLFGRSNRKTKKTKKARLIKKAKGKASVNHKSYHKAAHSQRSKRAKRVKISANYILNSNHARSNQSRGNHSISLNTKGTRARLTQLSQLNRRTQYGGTNCLIATVNEPAFNLPDSGGVTGLNISEARGILYRPNCKADTYQAMVPP
uniref:Uncharacterized protein n=1 Tax=viral metagenome TaxID=1070528 RepID=A0A6C0HP66_9ZZZZ